MSWWGEPQMKKSGKPSMGGKKSMMGSKDMMGSKGMKGPSLPSLFGVTPKKPEPDDRPKMPPSGMRSKMARMNRLKNRPI